MFNFYGKMSTCDKNFIRCKSYFNDLMLSLSSMFTWQGLEELEIKQELIERILISTGVCGIWKNDAGNYQACFTRLSGKFDKNYILDYANGYDYAGFNKQGKTNDYKSNVVGFNNSQYSPDYDIRRYADFLGEIDKSMYANLIKSRLAPLPVAHDSKTADVMQQVIKSIEEGEVKTILSEDFLSRVEGVDPVSIINLTDVSATSNLQYLTHFKSDIMNSFFEKYGMCSNSNNGKMAQQSVEEISNGENRSMILPYDRLRQRQEFAERITEFTGAKISVDFSESWKALNIEKGGAENDSERISSISE